MVWSSWWIAWALLESNRSSFQLHFSSLWLCNTTYSLCKVCIHCDLVFFDNFDQWKFWVISIFFLFLQNNSNIYYINDHLDKRTWTYIFGACCATTVFIPSFHNYRIWSFLGLGMTTYTAWYMAIAALIHGQVLFLSLKLLNTQSPMRNAQLESSFLLVDSIFGKMK